MTSDGAVVPAEMAVGETATQSQQVGLGGRQRGAKSVNGAEL